MNDFGEPNSGTSSGTSQIEEAARKAYELCRLGAAASTWATVNGRTYRVRVSDVTENLEELKVAGRAKE